MTCTCSRATFCVHSLVMNQTGTNYPGGMQLTQDTHDSMIINLTSSTKLFCITCSIRPATVLHIPAHFCMHTRLVLGTMVPIIVFPHPISIPLGMLQWPTTSALEFPSLRLANHKIKSGAVVKHLWFKNIINSFQCLPTLMHKIGKGRYICRRTNIYVQLGNKDG